MVLPIWQHNFIDEGTTQHDAVEIANAFEQVGARFSVAAHRDMFVVRLRSFV